jgi:hypothetical protein
MGSTSFDQVNSNHFEIQLNRKKYRPLGPVPFSSFPSRPMRPPPSSRTRPPCMTTPEPVPLTPLLSAARSPPPRATRHRALGPVRRSHLGPPPPPLQCALSRPLELPSAALKRAARSRRHLSAPHDFIHHDVRQSPPPPSPRRPIHRHVINLTGFGAADAATAPNW